jgi:DNA repair protein RadD
MQLRAYQQAALSALWDYLRCADGNPALVLPTGAGKSPLMAAIATEAVTNWQGRVGVIAHTQELVSQNADKLRQYAPDIPMGIYAAGLKRRDRFDPILFMQIQSVAKRAHELGRFDLLLVDEGHRIPLKDDGLYRQFIRDCKRFNPHLRVVVLTATPYRLQGATVPICGPEHIATEIAYEARVADLIADGYLSRLVSKAGVTPDLTGVHTRGGEYVESELAGAMIPLVERTVADMLARVEGRQCGVIFCVNTEHSMTVAEALRRGGETVAVLYNGMKRAERDDAIDGHKSGKYRWLVNVNIASEGYDNPRIDVVVMLRPTKSPGLYYQEIGRGFRVIYVDGFDLALTEGRLAAIAAGPKPDCLVLDYAGNVLEHGPVDAIKVRSARPGKAAAVETGRSKQCPRCEALIAIGVRQCECGYSFSSNDPAHLDRPVDAPVLSTDAPRKIATHTVRDICYSPHEKPGKTPSLRVTYHCGLRRFSEWVCLQHVGMARAKALRWWTARSDGPVPRTVDEAMALVHGLRRPARIVVDESDKYPEIVGYEWDEQAAIAAVEPVPESAPAWLAQALRRTA